MKDYFAKFFDELGLAGRGTLLLMRKKSFWPPFLITFIVFGTLINLLSNGFSSFSLIFSDLKAGDFIGGFGIIKSAFLGIFGINKNFTDWILNFVLIVLQSTLISLVVFVSKYNRKEKKSADSGLESSALVAGLAVLGSGCPTCGTTLLAPVLGTFLSGASGAISVAGKISLVLNIFAIILAIFVFKKLGLTTYAIIKSEQYTKKKELNNEKSS